MKSFSLATVLSVTTGILLVDFPDMERCRDYVSSHPSWRHRGWRGGNYLAAVQEAIFEDHPYLRGVQLEGIYEADSLVEKTRKDAALDQRVHELEREFGETILLDAPIYDVRHAVVTDDDDDDDDQEEYWEGDFGLPMDIGDH